MSDEDDFDALLRTHLTTRRVNEDMEEVQLRSAQGMRPALSLRQQQQQQSVSARARSGLHRPGEPPNPAPGWKPTGNNQSFGKKRQRSEAAPARVASAAPVAAIVASEASPIIAGSGSGAGGMGNVESAGAAEKQSLEGCWSSEAVAHEGW